MKVSNFWENNYIGNESKEDRNENLSLNKYLDKIKPYLKNIIIDFQNIWTIQLTVAISFIFFFFIRADEEHTMNSENDFLFFLQNIFYNGINKLNS